MGNEEQKIYEDEPISRLLGGLKRVDAPNDFDFRVKARIAKGTPADKGVSWFPAMVIYAVPLVLLLLVGGYFAFNAYYSNKKIDVPAVAETQPISNAPVNNSARNKDAVVPPDQLVAGQNDVKPSETGTKTLTKEPEKNAPIVDRPGGGSIDQAGRVVRKIYPRGFDPDSRTPLNPKGFDRSAQIPVKNVLAIIGINAVFTSSGWKVEAVSPKSIAESAGIKASDVIEAINDQILTEKTAFGNRFNGKSLRIRRDGKSIQIDLSH